MALEQQPALPKLHKSRKCEKISNILNQVVLLLEGLDLPWPLWPPSNITWVALLQIMTSTKIQAPGR